MFPELGHWQIIKDGDAAISPLVRRHYSASTHSRVYANDRRFVGPGQKLVLATVAYDAVFAWRLAAFRADGQQGAECAIFRNESSILSSILILEAEKLARQKWGGVRMFTFVNAAAVTSKNPGYCFQCAGWQRIGISKGGLIIFEKRSS